MKKNKGFTLIELLAIIVILAIIAVITVPIILNVIDNAKKGTAKDSAYGYKNAISKYYVSGMLEDESIKLDGEFKVLDGKLGELDIPFSGTKPTSGYLVYDNNILTGGCLTIDEYMVVFEEGEVKSVEVGECGSSSSLTACDTKHYTPSPGEWFNVDATTGTITGFSEAWDGTKDIVIPCTIEKDGVDFEIKNIGNNAFASKGLTSLVILDSVETISDYVMPGTFTLKEVVIGNGVSTIGSTVFSSCGIEKLILGMNVEVIGNAAFAGNKLTTFVLPDNLDIISPNAFAGNTSLVEVTVPKNVTEIGARAFNTTSLKSIYNKTGKTFDWGSIGADDSTGTYTFETGNVVRSDGSIIEVKK